MKRFFDKIRKTETCWNWMAASRGKTGYGAIKIAGKVVDAHRVSYMIHKGEIPAGMLVCHTCDNRKCVNPDHLFLGTGSDNMKDCVRKGRYNNKPKGFKPKHPSANAYRNGCRCDECRKLHRDYQRKNRLRLRQLKNSI